MVVVNFVVAEKKTTKNEKVIVGLEYLCGIVGPKWKEGLSRLFVVVGLKVAGPWVAAHFVLEHWAQRRERQKKSESLREIPE